MTEKEIKAHYQKLHDELTEAYYGGTSGLTKEEFDLQHGKIWADMELELIAGGFIEPPVPPRDLGAELDEFKQELKDLKQELKDKEVIA